MYLNLSQSISAQPSTLRTQRLARERLERSSERLSTGLKINRASDGPAALVASEFLRSRVKSLEQASENLQFGSNLISTAEGALSEVSLLLVQLRELTVQAANLPGTGETQLLQQEAEHIIAAIGQVGDTTRYGRTELFHGDFQRSVTVFPASSTGDVGVIRATVPEFSTISLGRHSIEFRSVGGGVSGFDASRATTGDGEFGQVTDGGGLSPLLPGVATDRFVFTNGVDWFVQEAGGLDEVPPLLNLTGAFTNVADVRLGADQNSIVFEADNGANRGIYQVTFAGVATQLAEGANDLDFDVTGSQLFPGTQELAFVSDSDFSVAPILNDIDGMAFATIGGIDSVFVVDNDAGLGGPAMQRYDVLGRPMGGLIDLTPIFGAGVTVDGLAYNGANLVGLDSANRLVHTFTTAGALVGTFALNTVTLGENYGSALTNGVAGSVTETGIPTVVAPAAVPVPEDMTLTFTEDAGAGITYQIDGSETGNLVAPGTAFVGGLPITVNGIQFTLDATQGASRSGGPLGAVALVNDTNDRLDVSLDGGVTYRTLDLTAGGPVAGGAAIAAAIQAQLNAAFGVGQASATYDGGSDRIVLTNLVGGSVTVQNAAAPSISGVFNDALLTITDGVNDVLNVSLDGAPGIDVDILPGGGPLVGGAAIQAAMQAAFDLAFGVGATRVVFDDGGDGPGTGNELFRLYSDNVNGLIDASISIGVPAGNDAAPTLLLGIPNGGTEGNDTAATDVQLGIANGGFEGVGANVLTGDIYVIDVTEAGVNASGLAYNATTGRLNIGDATTGFIHDYTLGGAQLDGGLDFGSLGLGNIVRLEHDPTTATGSFFVVTNAGTVVEIDDTPAAGPDNVTPTFVRSFAQPGTVRGIARFANPSFNPGGNNLFLGDDAGIQVRQYALRPATANYEDTLQNVYRQNLTTLAANQLSGEAGNDSGPEISENGTAIAYLSEAGNQIVTRNLAGGARIVQAPGLAATSIDSVSTTGRYVAYQTGAGGRVIDMTTGLVYLTGANQQFHPTLDQVFYESGGEVFRMDFPAGAVTQISGAGGRPSGTADFDLSQDGSLLAYRGSATGDVFVANSTGVGGATQLTSLNAGDSLTSGTQVRFGEDGTQVAMVGPGGDVFIRNANGTMIDVLEGGAAFDAGPTALPGNSLVRETFTITFTVDNDLGSPPAGTGDLFTVTGSVTGAQGTGRAGEAYVSPGNGLGIGAGLSFTIRPSGQYAVGTTITIDTDFQFTVSIDEGPEFVAPAGGNEIGFTPDGGALDLVFGSTAPAPGTVTFQEVLVEPGAAIQSHTELTRDDRIPYWIDALSPESLDLVPFDLEDFLARVTDYDLRSGGLAVGSAPTIVDGNVRTPSETLKIEFLTAATFNVTGSVSGPISENNAYVPGTPITVGNVEFTLAGVAAIGDEFTIDVSSSATLVDQAIDRVNRLRSLLGSTIQETDSNGRSNAVNLENLLGATSELRDLDMAQETSTFVREQILTSAVTGLALQTRASRESVLSLLRDNLVDNSSARI